MFYAVLAEVVYIAKLTNKYILLKYNCTGKFFGSSCCLYNKTVILLTRRTTVKYIELYNFTIPYREQFSQVPS